MELRKRKRHFHEQVIKNFPNINIFLMIDLHEPLIRWLDDGEGIHKQKENISVPGNNNDIFCLQGKRARPYACQPPRGYNLKAP